MGGLIGTATTDKDGLLGKDLYTNRCLAVQLANNAWWKLGKLSRNYSAMRFVGVDTASGTIIDIYIYNSVNDIRYAGNKSSKIKLKMNSSGEIYAQGPTGVSVSGWLYGDLTKPCIDERVGTTEPSGLTDIPNF